MSGRHQIDLTPRFVIGCFHSPEIDSQMNR
jgi:hypothetical protein